MIAATLIDLLCCPGCRGELRLAFNGLDCLGCNRSYAIRRGIPRFAEYGPAASPAGFRRTPRAAVSSSIQRQAEAEATFISKTAFSRGDLAGKVVLDALCGGGRYLEVVARWGATAIGVDLSGTVDTAAARLDSHPNVSIVQADPFRLPFKDGVFDVIYSGETLHLIADARRVFQQLPRHLKDHGTLAVWLRRDAEPAAGGVHGLVGRALARWRGRQADPPLAPPLPATPETVQWFADAGLTEIETLDLNSAVRGQRGAVRAEAA